jgi:hypothetical protein
VGCSGSAGTHIAYWAYFQTETQKVCKTVDGKPGAFGYDGKCRAGYHEPKTVEEVGGLIEQHAPKDKAPAMVEEILSKGQDLEPKPATELKGPAKVELEPKVKTETLPDGTTKTTTTQDVYNITYQGDTYTWNQTTITVNPDGSKVEEEKPPEVAPPSDVDIGQHPKLYERKYPDGFAGVWRDNTAAIAQTPVFAFLKGLNPNLATGGCPKFSLALGSVLGVNASGDVSPPCEVWAFLRVFFVLCALVFGG